LEISGNIARPLKEANKEMLDRKPIKKANKRKPIKKCLIALNPLIHILFKLVFLVI
jgi:hypothetical protein